MHIHAGSTLHNPVTLTFDPLTSGSTHADFRGPVMEYMCTQFGVDSLSRFSFTARTQTHRHADATGHPTRASVITGVGILMHLLLLDRTSICGIE